MSQKVPANECLSGPWAIRRATHAHGLHGRTRNLPSHTRPTGRSESSGVRSEPAVWGPLPCVTCSSNQTVAASGGLLARTGKPRSTEQSGARELRIGGLSRLLATLCGWPTRRRALADLPGSDARQALVDSRSRGRAAVLSAERRLPLVLGWSHTNRGLGLGPGGGSSRSMRAARKVRAGL